MFKTASTPNPGAATWREDQRGDAKDHTSPPQQVEPVALTFKFHSHTSPPQQNAGTTTGTAGLAEVIMLGCMPVREDYEV